tara:strand:+ start:589 stop:3684 length:3096 start_codon:yes stop_codon:yes gene_type:complete
MLACLPTVLLCLILSVSPSEAQRDTLSVRIRGSTSITFVKIDPGTFTMGASFSEPGRRPEDGPAHPVTISQGFWIGKFEVTQSQWTAVDGSKPWTGRADVVDAADRPVVYASRTEIRAWIDRLNTLKRTNAFRLPTEAEWEYAARAGTQTTFSFGDDESQLGTYAWFQGNTIDVGIREAQVVGQKAPNPWGLHDVHGNVREFLYDGLRNYDGRPQTDPRGTNGAPALKGGGFSDLNRELRSAARDDLGGDFATSGFGFRLYMRFDAPEPEGPPPPPPELPSTGVDTLTITTVAGSGLGDGGPATRASLSAGALAELAVDSQDRIYLTDPASSRVRRIDRDGTILTFAGNGRFGFSGDGGLATEATLNFPDGIYIDNSDNVFIADHLNHRIRRVDGRGLITTVVEVSTFGFSASFSPPEVADRFFAGLFTNNDFNDHFAFGPTDLDAAPSGEFLTVTGGSNAAGATRLIRISRSGQATRLVGRGIFSGTGVNPGRIAASPDGRVYYTQGGTVRWVDDDGTVQIIAGAQSGTDDDGVSALFADITPIELIVAPNGDLIVLDFESDRIRRIDSEGVIWTVAGRTNDAGFSGDGGPATNAKISNPASGVYDSGGNLYFHDLNNRRIRRIDTSGTITTIAGGGVSDGIPATDASLSDPVGVAVADDGTIYISDNGNHRIRRVDPNGIISTFAGTGDSGFRGDGGPATNARLNDPVGIDLDESGNLYIADRDNNRIRQVTPNGIITTVAGSGEAFGDLGDNGPATSATVGTPVDVVATGNGTFFIADQGSRRVRRVSAGTITTVAGNGLLGFSGDGGPATDAQIGAPTGLHITENGTLYLADTQSHRVRKVSPNGIITTVAGDGNDLFGGDGGQATAAYLNTPSAVALDADGNVLVVDSANDRVRRVGTDGVILTYLGTEDPAVVSDNGDGRSADEARLTDPTDIFITPGGDIYIADAGADRVRRISARAVEPPAPAFDPIDPALADFDGNGSVGFSDFLEFAAAFGGSESRFDIDESGTVDFGDFLRFASVFGDDG